MDGDDPYFVALKVFLVCGPLLGYAALELVLLLRDGRRRAKGRPLVPARRGGGLAGPVRSRLEE